MDLKNIKFRAKDMTSNRWIVGSLYVREGGIPPAIILPDWDIHSVYAASVQGYTDMKDAKGKEIYEGDVVIDIDDNRYQIGWCRWKMAWMAYRLGYEPILASSLKLIVGVMGNVYENPELTQKIKYGA